MNWLRWMKPPTAARLGISMALAVSAATVLMVINETGYVSSTAAIRQISTESDTRSQLNRLLQHMLDAETGQRGYLLTGDAKYLQPYDAALTQIGRTMNDLNAAYADDLQGNLTYAKLRRHVQEKLEEMKLSLSMRKQGNEDAWKFVLLTDVGKAQMDAIRSEAMQLIGDSTQKMEHGQTQVLSALTLSRLGIASVALVALLAFYLYLRQTHALRRLSEREQAVLQRERDQLERQVRERTATLAELATHLQNVREEERAHLARELHDELGALLTAAKLDLARLRSKLPSASAEALERLAHLADTLNSVIALKRRIIEDLRPSALDNLGLTASLEILVREFSERSGVRITCQLDPVAPSPAVSLTIYRLVQEALTNMGKYAKAGQAQVSLLSQGQQIEVVVSDNGQGFDLATLRAASHGLAGMRHRVEAAGGKLQVASQPGAGTRISAVVPLDQS